jgi:hypothetical protein
MPFQSRQPFEARAAGRAPGDTGGDTSVGAEPGDRSLVGLIKSLRDEATTLFRQEVALAKAELAQKFRVLALNAGLLVGGAAVALAGLLFLLFAAVAALRMGLIAAGMTGAGAWWLAALIVGMVVAGIGSVLVFKGVNTLRHESVTPRKTMESLQENTQWLTHMIR